MVTANKRRKRPPCWARHFGVWAFLAQVLHARTLQHEEGGPTISLAYRADDLPLHVVYFTAINPAHDWRGLISLQLNELVDFGLATAATSIFVEFSADGATLGRNHAQDLVDAAARLAQALIPKAHVSGSTENRYEYPGIHRAWELAMESAPASDSVVLYFHGKGMINSAQLGVVRDSWNAELTQVVIRPWRSVMRAMKERPEITVAGYALSPLNWVWFNFWYARSSYLRLLVEPQAVTRRWYYEDWMGRRTDPPPGSARSDQSQRIEKGYFHEGSSGGLTLCGNADYTLGLTYEPDALPSCEP